ncbi:hemolysin family protein [Marinilactibacillus psychrotolerans]|uniref:HlyC/CorC family transporter n=1 Tax=Marinilactibacillus psychrotolerans TaxID=191770 RepID=A0A5R9C368_9LACT|nr:hemolysin family protein [Marinilactibacillus psychrotolerans]TLQ07214.1 HlyC/CorC family transporter [Marinilactibacillus psychrotolerans]
MNSDPGSIQPLIGHVSLIILLTLIYGIFAAIEIALVSLNQTRIIELSIEGNKKAKKVLNLLEKSDDYLIAVRIILTLSALFSSALASFYYTDYLADLLGGFAYARIASMILITLIVSSVVLIFGEQLPKAVAAQNPDQTAMALVGIVLFVRKLFIPIVWTLKVITNGMKKILPIDFNAQEETMTRDEFRTFLEQSHHHEIIDLEEFSMLKGVLSLDNKIAREVMVPRTDSFMLDYDDSNRENIDAMLNTSHSRVPLYIEDKDNILGIIHVKNLLKASKEKPLYDIDLKEISNEALFVPETIYIDDLIFQMKRTQNQMAVLNDEYGGVVGIVTLEDLLEEIVGEIDDEYDETNNLIEQISEQEFIVEGAAPIDKFNDFFNTKIESENVDTIAGYFITEFGSVPSKDDDAFLKLEDLLMRVESLEGSRILTLRVEKIALEEDSSQLVEDKK